MSVALGGLGSIQFVSAASLPGRWLGYARLDMGFAQAIAYGYPSRSSPASRLAHASPSSRVLGEMSRLAQFDR